MGWLFFHRPVGTKTRDILRDELQQDYVPGEKTGFAVLHDALDGTRYWAVIERTDRLSGETQRFGLLCLTQRCRDHHNFGYKEIEENMGPAEIPPRTFYLKLEALVPEADGQYGREWRERCRAYYAKPVVISFQPGQLIELYGKPYALLENLGRRGFKAAGRFPGGQIYRITCKQMRTATLIEQTLKIESAPCN
jgi:hypothetical protein